jgi:S-adenosylmethionine-dependent methyltransferase
VTGSFGTGRDAWLDRLGRLRNVTRQELVTRQLAAHLPNGPAESTTVLDIGAGQGTQALRLAARGFQVTAVEPDPDMRTRLRQALAEHPTAVQQRVRVMAGGLGALPQEVTRAAYDVVLCQGVLMYLAEAGPALGELAAQVAAGGLLSLVFRNADGMALRPALRRDWQEMHDLLDSAQTPNPHYRNEIGVDARADHLVDIETGLARGGLVTEAWYGVRIATDGADPDEPAPTDPQELEAMLAAEEHLGRSEPYRQVATLLHLLSRRPAQRSASWHV